MSLLRASFALCGILALANTLLAESALAEYLAYLAALAAFGLATWWPDPLPPPPAPGQWSVPAVERERANAECSGCGREVDAGWSMCPYCSARL
jgi:hypothetical protein